MSDLRPLGSEKLTGDDKIKRIIEIANFKNKETKTKNITESVVTLADGKTYGIEREKTGYIIKVRVDESSDFEYRTNIKNRRYHKSFSQALKEMNLLAKELNRLNDQVENVDLFISEQKKFVLKTPKPEMELPPAEDDTTDLDLDMGVDLDTPEGEETDLNLDLDLDTPEGEDTDLDLDLDTPEGEDEDSTFKSIQKLTGKLGQKLRTLESQQGLSSEEIKYVLNSVISAVNLENLSEEDKDDVLENFEEEVEYDDVEGDIDIDVEDDMDLGVDSLGDELPSEPLEMVMDEIFSESKAEKVISKYYDNEVDKELESKKYLKETIEKVKVKKEINRLSQTIEQQISSEELVNENNNIKLLGRTNKKNLVFESKDKKYKVTPSGEIL